MKGEKKMTDKDYRNMMNKINSNLDDIKKTQDVIKDKQKKIDQKFDLFEKMAGGEFHYDEEETK